MPTTKYSFDIDDLIPSTGYEWKLKVYEALFRFCRLLRFRHGMSFCVALCWREAQRILVTKLGSQIADEIDADIMRTFAEEDGSKDDDA